MLVDCTALEAITCLATTRDSWPSNLQRRRRGDNAITTSVIKYKCMYVNTYLHAYAFTQIATDTSLVIQAKAGKHITCLCVCGCALLVSAKLCTSQLNLWKATDTHDHTMCSPACLSMTKLAFFACVVDFCTPSHKLALVLAKARVRARDCRCFLCASARANQAVVSRMCLCLCCQITSHPTDDRSPDKI